MNHHAPESGKKPMSDQAALTRRRFLQSTAVVAAAIPTARLSPAAAQSHSWFQHGVASGTPPRIQSSSGPVSLLPLMLSPAVEGAVP